MLSLYTNLAARLRRDEKGATAVEYGIMVALIAVVIIAAVTLLGDGLGQLFGNVQCQISGEGDTYVAGTPASGSGASAVAAVPASCTG